MKYSKIVIIYNPKSTGESKRAALDLQKELTRGLSKTKIECLPTKYAGHAEELACQISKEEKTPLIISSSGDGGYNEVINGAMRAGNTDCTCAVLPAGNANDHSRTMQDRPLADAIVKGKVTHLDLIKLDIQSSQQERTIRYAHSYVGLGLTPIVATELNRHTLNAFKEATIVLKTFFKYRPFKIRHDEQILTLDSLLLANINQMAKVLTLAPVNRPDDGKFEVISFPSGRKWRLLKRLTKAAISHLENAPRTDKYIFTAIKKMPMQIDGEVMQLTANSIVTVSSIHKILKTVV